jgi:D-arabinose 1-dehydrogenase-like Zn-dependent alcohol dehydrogenase
MAQGSVHHVKYMSTNKSFVFCASLAISISVVAVYNFFLAKPRELAKAKTTGLEDEGLCLSPEARQRKVWRVVPSAGSLQNLVLKSEILCPPGPEYRHFTVQVRVRSCGLNFADMFAVLGLYSATPQGSFIPGLEFCGEISSLYLGNLESKDDCSQEKCGFKVGDRVFGAVRFGGYASYLNVDARQIRKVPKSWSFDEGAAFPCQAITAWYGLKALGDARNGQVALVHSAAGGVGLYCVNLLHHLGVRVIGKSRFLSKLNFHKLLLISFQPSNF